MDKAEELFGPMAAEGEPAPQPEVQQEAPQPEPAPEPTPDAPQPPQPEPAPEAKEHTVPLAKFLDLRDENKELKRWKADQEAKLQQQQAPKAPDPIDDPEGYAVHVERIAEAKATKVKFDTSDVIARREFGDDTVNAAADWAVEKAKSDPTFSAQYMREPHPIDWIVRQHKRDAMLTEIGDDPNDWFTREAAKRGYAPTSAPPAAEASAATVPPVAAPTPSLVNQPSSGGISVVAAGPTSALETVFPR